MRPGSFPSYGREQSELLRRLGSLERAIARINVGGGPVTDTTPPGISSIGASTTTNSATIGWSTNEAADTEVEYGPTVAYGSMNTLNVSMVLTHSSIISGLSPSTTYHYRVRSRDNAGNLSVSADQSFTTGSAADVTAPTILSPSSASGLGTNSAVITWGTNEAATSQVEYGTTTSYGTLSTLSTTLVTSHSITLTGLAVATLYHFRILTRDAAGNLATSSDFTFTTLSANLFFTDFTGANGTPWPAHFTMSQFSWSGHTDAGLDIQNNAGRLMTSDGSEYNQMARAVGATSIANAELLLKFRPFAIVASYFGVVMRGSGTWNPETEHPLPSGYVFRWEPGWQLWHLQEVINSQETELGTSGYVWNLGVWQWLRFQTIGTNIRLRTWADGTAEPSSWAVDVTRTGLTGAGRVMLYSLNGMQGYARADYDEYTLKAL